MTTVNERVRAPRAHTINGIDAGGMMTARITEGYDEENKSSPDGLQVPLKDKYTEFVRGTITTQDLTTPIAVMTGIVGTLVFYEKRMGGDEITGYIKHTINNPIVHRINISSRKGQYGTITYDFECLAADETEGILDMWEQLDGQAAPTYIEAARGGWRIASAVWSTAISIYHITAFDFTLAANLIKESNDLDVGYTCCEAVLEGLTGTGSLSFQDATIDGTPAILKLATLITSAPDKLVLTIVSSQGAAAKVLTLLGVDWISSDSNSDVNATFTEYTGNFEIVNNLTTQLTLAGTNKILDIA